MFYPEEFKTRVRAAYPNLPKLYDHMEAGERHMVKQFLEAGIEIKQGVSFEDVLAATSLEELQAYAKLQQERAELLKEWKELDRKDRRDLFIHKLG